MSYPMIGQQASITEALSPYTTAELIYTVNNLLATPCFLLDLNFTKMAVSDKAEVAIDIIRGKRRLAPFVSPLSEGKPVESLQTQTKFFRPPYIKDLRNPDFMKPVYRAVGEAIGGTLSPEERYAAILGTEIQDQIDMINRRCEWMAAQALLTGKIVAKGEGYSSPIEIDFQRDPELSVALTGNAQWGQDGVSPTAYVESWATTMLKKSGVFPSDIIFTNSAWDAFSRDPRVVMALLSQRDVGPANFQLGTNVAQGGVPKGVWGNFRLWLYNDWYVDPHTDTEEPMLPDGTVLLCGPGLEGVRSYGLIMDPQFAYGPLAYAPKMWINENPAQINLLMQSAPLIIPTRVNASFSAQVITPGT